MPGELKNLVALAISSTTGSSGGSSSKYHHPQHQPHHQPQQQQQQLKHEQEKKKPSSREGGGEAARRNGGQNEKKHTHQLNNGRSKEESGGGGGGGNRFTKLLSKSVGAVSATISSSSSIPPPPPSVDAIAAKRAPVASPESDGSSLLNGGSCCGASTSDHDDGRGREEDRQTIFFYETRDDAGLFQLDQIGDETPRVTRPSAKNEPAKTRRPVIANGSAMIGNGRKEDANEEECSGDEEEEEEETASEKHRPSTSMIRHRCSTDISRGAETDDETLLTVGSSLPGVGAQRGANREETTGEAIRATKAPSTSTLTTTSVSGQQGAESNGGGGWYSTRKSYRSVAYKTWTVGSARKLLNSSRSDYDLPPTSSSYHDAARRPAVVRKTTAGSANDGSVSDGEEKFYNCTYSRSQDDDLDKSIYSTMSGVGVLQSGDTSYASASVATSAASAALPAPGSLTLADLNKMKARKCASSDAVTLFANIRDSNSFLSPVESVPSTSSEKTSSLSQSKRLAEAPPPSVNGNSSVDPVEKLSEASAAAAALIRYSSPSRGVSEGGRPTSTEGEHRSRPNQLGNGTVDKMGNGNKENGRSWLLVASSSSDDVWREENGRRESSRRREENNNKDPISRMRQQRTGSRSTGDCFSSEDYFKFTLKKRLLQQRQQQPAAADFDDELRGVEETVVAHHDWYTAPRTESPQRILTPPLLALDRDIRAALHNFADDFNNTDRSASPTKHNNRQQRSSSPTTLSTLMTAAQQRWRQQSERFTRRMEQRGSCRGGKTIENGSKYDSYALSPSRLIDPRCSPLPPPPTSTSLIKIAPSRLSSSSFSSSSSSSSSSMSWISQQSKHLPAQQRTTAATYSPLAIAVESNGGDQHEDDWTPPSDPLNAAITQRPPSIYSHPMRNRSKTTASGRGGGGGPNSPFRSTDEAMQFLKRELENIRKKDHQILTQLKLLDAEISRRKSETDALAPIRSSSESEDLDKIEFPPSHEPPGPLLDRTISKPKPIADHPIANGMITTPPNGTTEAHLDPVPPMPKCLEINFKTL